MPTRFLSDEQRAVFGKFALAPTSDQLASSFHLDDSDRETIGRLRGSANRLGFAVLLCSVRFTGTFPTSLDDIPSIVISTLAEQLDVSDIPNMERYFEYFSATRQRHCELIRTRFEFREFHTVPSAVLGVCRNIYSFCWSGEDRPSILFDWAVNWLIAKRIILPGVSTLERLVARIRERARLRLWRKLIDGLGPNGQKIISALFEDDSLTRLELLRASPLKRKQADLWRHLDRLDNLRSFNLSLTPPKGVPATHLEKLARVARHAKPSAIASLKEPRRTATVAALFYTLEATAQDEAIELSEALIADMYRKALNALAVEQAASNRLKEQAAFVLRDLAVMVLDSESTHCNDLSLIDWKTDLYQSLPQEEIKQAIDSIGVRAEQKSKPLTLLKNDWRKAKKIFTNLISCITLDYAPGGEQLKAALTFMRDNPDWGDPRIMKAAPTEAVPKAWQDVVLDTQGLIVDPKAYVFAIIEAWQKALKRRDVFVKPGIRYADPRVGMLKGKDWQTSKAMVCQALSINADGKQATQRLSAELGSAFRQTAERAEQNSHLSFEVTDVKTRIKVKPLDKLEKPSSLIELRRNIRALMPKAGIPDILLEVMERTGFASSFTHLSERPSKVENFETSLCAALISGACNIGFEPLVRTDIPALTSSRLSWVTQHFIREDTLKAASAKIVSAHKDLPIVQHWGNGSIASADRLRFVAPKTAIHAGPNPKYFGQGRGITWYNMLSDQHTGLGAMVIPGTLRDSLAVLALLLEQETEIAPGQVMTDTAAYSDTIFGLFWLLGYQFSPRLADIGGARVWRVDKEADYGPFNAVIDGTINTKLIEQNWDDLVCLAGSLKLGKLKAEGVMRILQVRDTPTTLAKALVQLGRLVKTMHVLAYVDDEAFRRTILIQLNRQEFRHKLARKIYHGQRGEVRNALKQGQEEELGMLGLVLNAAMHWNAIYMQEAVTALQAQGFTVNPSDLARVSPCIWRHINFLGRYEIALPESVRNGGLRPLRDLTSEWDF